MGLRCDGGPLQAGAVADARSKVAVLVHGLCMNDRQWARSAAADAGGDVAAGLLRELGYSVLHLHYNSGRPISHNGRDFADLLHALSAQWPMPIEELDLIGNSLRSEERSVGKESVR